MTGWRRALAIIAVALLLVLLVAGLAVGVWLSYVPT